MNVQQERGLGWSFPFATATTGEGNTAAEWRTKKCIKLATQRKK